MVALLRFTGKDVQDIEFSEWLEQKSPDLRQLVVKWFNAIGNVGDMAEIVFHDGHPTGCVEGAPFAYVNAYKAHVNLGFFYGAEFPDEPGLLGGSGKRMRHIKLFPDQQYDDEKIYSLLELAYADILERLMTE